MYTNCIIAEEEVQPEERQLALRPADMSFEQAMLHYMAQMNDRQGFMKASIYCVSMLQSNNVMLFLHDAVCCAAFLV